MFILLIKTDTLSVFCKCLALGYESLGCYLIFRVGILVQESVALVLGILETLKLLLLHTLLCQLKLALHNKQRELLAKL